MAFAPTPASRVPLALVAFAVLLAGCQTETNPLGPETLEFFANGIREPRCLPASEVELDDDEMVIGVSIGNRHRAYVVNALRPPRGFDMRYADEETSQRVLGRHVINDLLDGTPVSVTYCDLNRCIRVFTGSGNRSLDLAINGRQNGFMELRLYRKQFLQEAPDAPLPDLPYEHTTWGSWKSAHPDTDVYGSDLLAPFNPPSP